MGARSDIEWTDATWNPARGCSRVSEGCRNCYAERVAGRFSGPGQPYEGLARRTPNGARWTGTVRFVPEHLADPLRWRRPRRVFVNSMSDLFHESLDPRVVAAVFGVMAFCPHHTFQILTKRPEVMRDFFARFHDGDIRRNYNWWLNEACLFLPQEITKGIRLRASDPVVLPLPNVWLGVSAEDQATADERIPHLMLTPAAVRFVSYEPALGPVDFHRHGHLFGSVARRIYRDHGGRDDIPIPPHLQPAPTLDWIIAGSESGPGARPAEVEWFRSVRDQCEEARAPFFFKQWVGPRDGLRALGPALGDPARTPRGKVSLPVLDGRQHVEWPR